jgi:hypothetical protein
MAMAQGRERDRGKERDWRQVLRQWQRSGQRVRAFCVEHGLSEPSFYAWRRTIQQRDQEAARGPRRHSRQAGGQVEGTDAPRCQGVAGLPAFVPVMIAAPAPVLEIVLRDGHLVRVPVGFDAATLRQLLAVLDEAPPC